MIDLAPQIRMRDFVVNLSLKGPIRTSWEPNFWYAILITLSNEQRERFLETPTIGITFAKFGSSSLSIYNYFTPSGKYYCTLLNIIYSNSPRKLQIAEPSKQRQIEIKSNKNNQIPKSINPTNNIQYPQRRLSITRWTNRSNSHRKPTTQSKSQ